MARLWWWQKPEVWNFPNYGGNLLSFCQHAVGVLRTKVNGESLICLTFAEALAAKQPTNQLFPERKKKLPPPGTFFHCHFLSQNNFASLAFPHERKKRVNSPFSLRYIFFPGLLMGEKEEAGGSIRWIDDFFSPQRNKGKRRKWPGRKKFLAPIRVFYRTSSWSAPKFSIRLEFLFPDKMRAFPTVSRKSDIIKKLFLYSLSHQMASRAKQIVIKTFLSPPLFYLRRDRTPLFTHSGGFPLSTIIFGKVTRRELEKISVSSSSLAALQLT